MDESIKEQVDQAPPLDVNDRDPEVDAIACVFNALKGLDRDAQTRVLDYVLKRLSLRD